MLTKFCICIDGRHNVTQPEFVDFFLMWLIASYPIRTQTSKILERAWFKFLDIYFSFF